MNLEIVRRLWQESDGQFAFISFRTPEGWQDNVVGPHMLTALHQPDGWDMFFTPLTFSNTRRLAQNAVPGSLLYADLDPVEPQTIDPEPQIAWETSPGSYQAAWLLDAPVPYSTQWADLNRRMTYHTGADSNGWSPAKVLRVPGSVNYKYDEAPQGRLLWSDWDSRYSLEAMQSKLPELHELKQTSGEVAPPIITDHAELNRIWARMPAYVQHYLTKTNVGDRSRFIVSTAHKMREAEVSKEDAYHMLWYAPYCKWRFRNNPDRLWAEITTVYEKD